MNLLVYGPDHEAVILHFLEADADAFVVKTAPIEDLLTVIRQLRRRSLYLKNPAPGGHMDQAGPTIHSSRDERGLSRREHEILELAASGLTSAEIAERSGVTLQTVKFHLGNVYKKLGVKNRTQAVRWFLSRD